MTEEAFLSILLPMQDRLFRTAYRLLLDQEEAKDVVQDVMIKLWNRRDEFYRYKNAEAWCITVTKNTALDRVKHRKYRMTNDLSYSETSTLVLDLPLDTKDIFNITRRIINGLPEKQRLLIQLRDIEGLSYETVAEVMDLSLGEVKIGLFRARSAIREQIKKMNSYGIR